MEFTKIKNSKKKKKTLSFLNKSILKYTLVIKKIIYKDCVFSF